MGFTDVMGKIGGAIGDAVDAVGDAVGDAVDAVGDAAGAVVDTVGEIAGDVFSSVGDVVGSIFTGGAESSGMIVLPPRRSPLPPGLEYDPPSITQPENWQAYSHEEIYSINQRSLDEGRAAAVADGWREIAESLRQVGETLQRDATAAIESGWEGEAANQASDSVRPVVEWTQLTSEAFEVIGTRIHEAATAAGQAKEAVPEPEGHSIGRTLTATVLGGPFGAGVDAVLQMRNRQEAERGAQDAMARLLTPAYMGADQSVPALPGLDGGPTSPPRVDPDVVIDPPPPPVDIGGGPTPGPAAPFNTGPDGSDGRHDDRSGGRGDSTGKPGPDSDGRGDTSRTPSPAPHRTDPSWVESRPPVGSGPGAPGPGGGGPGGRDGGFGGVVPPGAGGIAGGGGAGAGRVGGAGAGRAGGLGTPAGPGAGALGAGGRAGVGVPGGSGAGAGGAAAGAGAGSSTGRGGMMGAGMGAGAARGAQGGDDQEHERPSWLEEDDDVWFDGMPKTAPPVFGA